jgi:2-amino-4-hydroxy-6-hydroxymethyldihydropteridine diphosphokinase
MNFPDPTTTNNLESQDHYPTIIALGSNLASVFGPPAITIEYAIRGLRDLSNREVQHSSLWQTVAEECPEGSPPFVNAVAVIEPLKSETAHSLLNKLQAIEAKFGRLASATQNAPRTLDLDLICFAQQVINTPLLRLPHPRAHKRAFVLGPLAEVFPELRLPGQDLTVLELLTRLPNAKAALTNSQIKVRDDK